MLAWAVSFFPHYFNALLMYAKTISSFIVTFFTSSDVRRNKSILLMLFLLFYMCFSLSNGSCFAKDPSEYSLFKCSFLFHVYHAGFNLNHCTCIQIIQTKRCYFTVKRSFSWSKWIMMTHFAIVWHICGLLGNVTPNVYFIKKKNLHFLFVVGMCFYI